MKGMRLMPMKMKAKLVVLSVGALWMMMFFLVDYAEGRRLSQLPESECDFDFKEQPEDFFVILDSSLVSGGVTWPDLKLQSSALPNNRCRRRSQRMISINSRQPDNIRGKFHWDLYRTQWCAISPHTCLGHWSACLWARK